MAAMQKSFDHISVWIGFRNYDAARVVIRDGVDAADRQLRRFSGNKAECLHQGYGGPALCVREVIVQGHECAGLHAGWDICGKVLPMPSLMSLLVGKDSVGNFGTGIKLCR